MTSRTLLLRRQRFLSYPRQRYREELWSFLVRNRLRLIGLIGLFVAGAAVNTALLQGYLRGLMDGVLAASLVAVVLTAFHAATGSIRRLGGAWGEDSTRDVLAKARRRKLIHGWVDAIRVPNGDIDHLVVLPDGQLLAIDSKWHSVVDEQTVRRDVEAARVSARRARSVLRHLKRLPEVSTAVVVWGGARFEVPELTVDEVDVVRGESLLHLLRERQPVRPDRQAAEAALRELLQFRREIGNAEVMNRRAVNR